MPRPKEVPKELETLSMLVCVFEILKMSIRCGDPYKAVGEQAKKFVVRSVDRIEGLMRRAPPPIVAKLFRNVFPFVKFTRHLDFSMHG